MTAVGWLLTGPIAALALRDSLPAPEVPPGRGGALIQAELE